MQELITIHNMDFDGTEQQTVNARELHNFLEIGKDFSNWVKAQIERAGFAEGIDFVKTQDLSSPKKASSKSRPQLRIEYHFTLNAAKEISMMSNSSKGKEARLYFIKCEKDLMEIKRQQSTAVPDYSNLSKIQILEMAIESEQQRIALENQNKGLQKQIEEDAPMVAFAQKVSDYGDAVLLDIAAKSVSMKPKEYWDAIRRLGWLRRDNHPMQFAIDRGYMKVRVFEVKHKSGMISYSYTPLICSKGQVKVAELCHFTFQKQQELFEERTA